MKLNLKKLTSAATKAFSDSLIFNNIILLLPLNHFAQGFLIERTPYAGRFYVRRILAPLFSPPWDHLSLNYSPRVNMKYLSDAPYLYPHIDEDGFIKRFIESLIFEKEERINIFMLPLDFLKICDPDSPRINMIFERAVAHCLSGNLIEGRRILDIVANVESSNLPDVVELARETLFSLDRGIDDFNNFIDRIERENIARFFPNVNALD